MNTIRAFLLSSLVRQRVALKDGFQQRYPSAWLVWEPPPGSPPEGCLCFELDEAMGAGIRVGRGAENSIVINDPSVSQDHLVLELRAPGQWRASSLQAEGTLHRGAALVPGAPADLANGDRLRIGSVDLSFHDSPGLGARLDRLN